MTTDELVIDSSPTNNVSSINENSNIISKNDETLPKVVTNKKWTREYKYKFFFYIITLFFNIFINYDTGSVPVMLNWIQEPYNFNSTELGVMGSLPYVGTVLFTTIWSYVFSNYSTKNSLFFAYGSIGVSIVLFGSSVHKYMFYVAKFCKGSTLAGFALFYPVWVDTFAPVKHRNLWMSTIQSGLIVGVTVGYVITSIYSYAGKYGWRYSILTQFICFTITFVFFWMIPKEFVDFNRSEDEKINFDLCTCEKQENIVSKTSIGTTSLKDECDPEDEEHLRTHFKVKSSHSIDIVIQPVSSLIQQKEITKVYSNLENLTSNTDNPKCSKCILKNVENYIEFSKTKKLKTLSKFLLLCKNSIFMLSCLVISSVYFEAFGAQFWMTKVVVSHFNINERKVFLIFSYIFMSSQLTGLIIGSHVIDRVSHYYPKNPIFVDYVLIAWALIVSLASAVMIFYKNLMALFIGNLIVFYYSGPIPPTLLLRSIQSVHYGLKPTATSVVMLHINILGFIGGTLVPGIVVDLCKGEVAAIYIIYFPAFISLLLLVLICFMKRRLTRNGKPNDILSRPKSDVTE